MPAEQGKTGPGLRVEVRFFVAHWRGSRRRERGGSGSGYTIFPLFSGNVVCLHRYGRRLRRRARIPTGPAAFSAHIRSHRTGVGTNRIRKDRPRRLVAKIPHHERDSPAPNPRPRPKTSLMAKKPRHERHNNGPTPGKSWKRGLMARKPHHEGDSPTQTPGRRPKTSLTAKKPRHERPAANSRHRGKNKKPERREAFRLPVPPQGLEPWTRGLRVRCSSQLSYRGNG